MSEGAPSNRLPRKVEPRKLAYSEATFNGIVPVDSLKMLASAAHSIVDVDASLSFSVDDRGKRVVTGTLRVEASMVCQRCMNPVEARSIEAEVAVAIVWDEDEAKQLPSDLDPWVVSEDEADLYALIEEELLLNLPNVVYHDYECVDPSLLSVGEPVVEQDSGDDNPFKVLAQLKKQQPKD